MERKGVITCAECKGGQIALNKQEIIATWPKWKQELVGIKRGDFMEKTNIERLLGQFELAMANKGLNMKDIANVLGCTRANISYLFKKKNNLNMATIERFALAIGGTIEINFIPSKPEIELLREENERLRKQLGAKRYVENGTLNKR